MRKMEPTEKEDFLKFIIEMEQNETLNEIKDKILGLVAKILDAVKEDLNIDYSLYTSEIALISSVNQT